MIKDLKMEGFRWTQNSYNDPYERTQELPKSGEKVA